MVALLSAAVTLVSAAPTPLSPGFARPKVGVLTKDVPQSLNLYAKLANKDDVSPLLPEIIALPIVNGNAVKECERGMCKEAIEVARKAGAEFAFFDVLNMGEHAWTTKELEQAAETYGIKKVDLKAFILQGAVKHLADYTALGVDLGFFNEATMEGVSRDDEATAAAAESIHQYWG